MKITGNKKTALLTCAYIICVISYTACKKNDCGNTSCQNGGVCTGDTCSCLTGYIGNDCGTSWSTQYIGTYNCTQVCSPPFTGSWQSVITANSTSGQDTIVISNFGDYNKNVVAGVDNNGNISILPTNTSDIAGKGKLENGVMKVTYSIIGAGSCTLTMTKQ